MDSSTAIGFRNLRIFSKVAEMKGIRKAADAVSLSQPTVSQAIARLEAQIGTHLFERRPDGLVLTRAGAILAYRSDLMFGQIEEALHAFGISSSKSQTADMIIQRMNRSQIRVLNAVNDKASLVEAAAKFGISSVSIHRAARELAHNLGRPIFEGSPTGPVASPAVTNLARQVSLAIRESEWAIEEIRSLRGDLHGDLRIGAMPFGGGFLLGSVLEDITTHLESAHTHMSIGDGCALANALRSGEIDFIVGMVPSSLKSGEIHSETLISSPLVVVGRRDHPLTNGQRAVVADLEDYDWVVPTRGATRRAAFDTLFATMKARPNTIEAYSPSTFRFLIGESDRLTLMTRFEFDYESRHADLAMLPITPPGPAQPLGIAWRAEWHPTALHMKFAELIRTRAAKIAGQDLPNETVFQPNQKSSACPAGHLVQPHSK